jgi:hypothetical protein
MAIGNVEAGKLVYLSKLNEIIAAIGSIDVSWVNFVGSTGVVRNSAGNIASITREAAGAYKILFTSPRASINYAVKGICTATAGNDTGFISLVQLTRSFVRIECRNDDGGRNDPSIVCLIIQGPDPNNRSSALSAITIFDQTVSEIVSEIATGSARFTLNSDGTTTYSTTLSGSGSFPNWVEDVSEADSFEARATLLSGTTPAGSALGSWLDLTSTRFWEINNDAYFYVDSTFRLDIRDKASLQVRGSAIVTLSIGTGPGTGGGD